MQFKHIFGMICATVVFASFGPTILSAQPYSISWFTIDGGGGYAAGGTFELEGTIGQYDAGAIMTGGNFQLAGGFWADGATAQTPVGPTAFTRLRGAFVSGDLSDVQQSDDSYLKHDAGLTLNPDEPPVWIEFEGTLPTDSPTSLSVTLEASVSTPNLGQTIEAFNWLTGQYEEVDFQPASSGNDLVVTIDLTADIDNYVQSGTGAVKIQAKWKYTGGLILGFPWRVSIDQVVWTVTE